jgi:hypothetical protein
VLAFCVVHTLTCPSFLSSGRSCPNSLWEHQPVRAMGPWWCAVEQYGQPHSSSTGGTAGARQAGRHTVGTGWWVAPIWRGRGRTLGSPGGTRLGGCHEGEAAQYGTTSHHELVKPSLHYITVQSLGTESQPRHQPASQGLMRAPRGPTNVPQSLW